jgi:hypothetical protein
VILILEGEEVDIFDDGALTAAIARRTERVLADMQTVSAPHREKQLLNIVTFIALKAGALAAYHSARPDEPIDRAHLVEIAQQLQQAVGLNFIQPEPQPAAPQIILPPGAALEGEDSGS